MNLVSIEFNEESSRIIMEYCERNKTTPEKLIGDFVESLREVEPIDNYGGF